MTNAALDELLNRFSEDSKTQREKGTTFEHLAQHYFTYDRLQNSLYDRVWMYGDWARETGRDATDRGVDLVARRRDGSGLAAIQAKFYERDRSLRQTDLSKFIAESTRTIFKSRILIETTDRELSKNAQILIGNQEKPFTHIKRKDLEESSIDWSTILNNLEVRQRSGKQPRDHQREALKKVLRGFDQYDRGQLIMACGTGKTYTGQLVAESIVGVGGHVLVLVPSLALMAQTILEWNRDASVELRSFSACSDASVGKRRNVGNRDVISVELQDLALPATTDAELLAMKVKETASERMTVIFSTYQSIDVIEKSQKQHGLPNFDLIICDEAHRTTGKIVDDKEDSNFVRVHDQEHIRGNKRLYMTATPRIFTASTKKTAQEGAIELCSMDDEKLFGKLFHYYSFGKAVADGLLTDYRVLVLALDEGEVSRDLQNLLARDNELNLDSATRILGCYKALNKNTMTPKDFEHDPDPMQRALLFCNTIANSKLVTEMFNQVVDVHKNNAEFPLSGNECNVSHVDGTFNSKVRTERLNWLERSDTETCHILSNVRCLGEGVDVPSLDAVIFMHPRKSQIDVVQAVGRVMRLSQGKRMGYIILPIGVPAGTDVETALRDNKKYQVVWQTLNALRSHDERLEAGINAMAFGDPLDERIMVSYGSMIEIAQVDGIPADSKGQNVDPGIGTGNGGNGPKPVGPLPPDLFSVSDAFVRGLSAMVVKKCGSQLYWSDWASDIADIAQAHITRIGTIVARENTEAREVFDQFLRELRDDLNPSVTEDEAVEMLAQHLITRPVFDAVFEDHPFSENNSVSKALESVLELLDAHHVEKEAETLKTFYDSVRTRASQVKKPSARQDLIRQLYDRFFQTAFKRVSERLGIVYTPVELVDYILHSVEDVLHEEFGCSIGDKRIHVLDPFTGTGTFLARLIESDLIQDKDLRHKYRNELHANDILLLAYYIAGMNIEQAYYTRLPNAPYETFNRLLLTDTFNLDEAKGVLAKIFPVNQERIDHQRKLDIRVIVGNPPYSAWQKSANDNAQNLAYESLDAKIASTYGTRSNAKLKISLKDSYIRAIKWASERIGNRGVVAFVTNAGWLDGNAQDGMRKCLAEEYSKIWIVNLRGNARTSGERRRKEAGNVFESGSRAAVAINILLKNPDCEERGRIHYHDIGDYLSREEKLSRINELGSIVNTDWKLLVPDGYGDWINQRDPTFDGFPAIGEKRAPTRNEIFGLYSRGLATGRDAWCYNSSRKSLEANVRRSIDFFNGEVERFQESSFEGNVNDFINRDATKFSWDIPQRRWVQQGRHIRFEQRSIRASVYRPFTKTSVYFNRTMNNSVYRLSEIFPDEGSENLVICVSGVGATKQSSLMVDTLPDLEVVSKSQCFPLYHYVQPSKSKNYVDLSDQDGQSHRVNNISETTLGHFREVYPSLDIDEEGLFYYVYGILHSPDYRERFSANLLKQLPRIPDVKSADDFLQFSKIGRTLGALHVGYENLDEYPLEVQYSSDFDSINQVDNPYRVTQMKFAKSSARGGGQDKSTIEYNPYIKLSGIPLDAYEYVVNGKSAIEWVMERQCVKTDKSSGILNDANDYASETVGDASYPLKLLKKIVTLSQETVRLIRELPKLRI